MIEKTTWSQLGPLYQYLRKQADNKKFLKYLEIGATFSLITIFLFFAIKPTATAISTLVGEIKSKELNIKNMKNKIIDLMKAQDLYSQVQEKYSLVDSSFPSNQRLYQVASNFSTVSQQSSVANSKLFFNLNTADTEKSNTSESYKVVLSGTGQYPSILEVIKKLASTRRLVDIKSIQISNSDELNNKNVLPGSVTFSISSDLFYLPSANEKK
jgi:Tfp pilus assembly protein PilO